MYIIVKNKKEYDNLMTIYQDKGWHWYSGSNPKDVNLYTPTYIEYKNYFMYTPSSEIAKKYITFSIFSRKFKMKKLL